jgi:hypothetical protein
MALNFIISLPMLCPTPTKGAIDLFFQIFQQRSRAIGRDEKLIAICQQLSQKFSKSIQIEPQKFPKLP